MFSPGPDLPYPTVSLYQAPPEPPLLILLSYSHMYLGPTRTVHPPFTQCPSRFRAGEVRGLSIITALVFICLLAEMRHPFGKPGAHLKTRTPRGMHVASWPLSGSCTQPSPALPV
ncbi:hypothetical protein BOTBODRAFT_259886 [Botryobasidium botryosum FD-172 SS1]|uniref:Uncharacterized protein n=1 Tax=Botryobasidium botryosum (strain FD-172 SS1) TaxID=930990 RepID=A0A067MXT7_BOTB1|nr:hypothetical protein BOTBODRAFT_259886 [Botryobasidium botryosum FD-172 SS1]